ncbi:uncharacterized protein PAC_14894 [Phialocephala subalpina]|uniref:Uncharacterized protein n=1 Tax=Phialocephala subalpina TaxID=576137 RepID=A0A1L7XIZ5_9HELO|nr:uncharacterized protein PAC_14894 [Phialocephala subalpina]
MSTQEHGGFDECTELRNQSWAEFIADTLTREGERGNISKPDPEHIVVETSKNELRLEPLEEVLRREKEGVQRAIADEVWKTVRGVLLLVIIFILAAVFLLWKLGKFVAAM